MTHPGEIFRTAIVLSLFAWGSAAAGGAENRLPESTLAAPGSPLYESAVTESVRSLMSKEDQAELEAVGRPPSPGPDYFWCEQCKTYHRRQAPPAAAQPGTAQRPGAVGAAGRNSNASPVTRPPSPGPDYYWCENCKTYHRRQPSVGQAAAPPSTPIHAAPAAAQGNADGDYYYCENCKVYHRRPPAGQSPTTNASPALGGTSNSPSWNPLLAPPAGKP
jgi:hypothetical protein